MIIQCNTWGLGAHTIACASTVVKVQFTLHVKELRPLKKQSTYKRFVLSNNGCDLYLGSSIHLKIEWEMKIK